MSTKTATKTAAKKAPAKKAAPTKSAPKATISPQAAQVAVKAAAQAAKAAPTKKAAPKLDGQSKADKARELFNKMKNASRQDILKAFIDQAGLTKAGANTYLANIKKQANQ